MMAKKATSKLDLTSKKKPLLGEGVAGEPKRLRKSFTSSVSYELQISQTHRIREVCYRES